MKIPLKSMELRLKSRVVGCGVQGDICLAIDLSQGKGGKWTIHESLAGRLGDESFAAQLSKMTGRRHFWVSPNEEGGLQVETARAIEIPEAGLVGKGKGKGEDFFRTQIQSRFVNETVVFGGLRMKGAGIEKGVATHEVHPVGGGAIQDNVTRDYHIWYATMGIRRPHIASTALALANAYLALYPREKRLATPLRLVVLKGRSNYRGILMDGWKYIDEVLLPRMNGDDAAVSVIESRIKGWVDYFTRQYPGLICERTIVPLIIAVKETWVSHYEHWDLWGEYAQERIDMTDSVADAILLNRDIAPVAFGMALQGGC